MEKENWTNDMTVENWQDKLEEVETTIGKLRINRTANLFAAGCYLAISLVSLSGYNVPCCGLAFATSIVMLGEAVAFHNQVQEQKEFKDDIEKMIRLKQKTKNTVPITKKEEMISDSDSDTLILGDDGEFYLSGQFPEGVTPLEFDNSYVKSMK